MKTHENPFVVTARNKKTLDCEKHEAIRPGFVIPANEPGSIFSFVVYLQDGFRVKPGMTNWEIFISNKE